MKMIDEVKVLLGDAAENFTDSQIEMALKLTINEIENYCNRQMNESLLLLAERIAVVKLNRTNTEGLASQSYSGVSENYVDGYPADIQAQLNKNRKIKTL